MFELIAGPCVIESEEHARFMAQEIKTICDELKIPLIFKASFDKANRTKLESYRGPGLEEGLRILSRIRRDFGLRVTSDIHEVWQAEPAAQVLDIIQIPAFLCRQTDLLIAAGKTGKIVNLKKGQFMPASAVPMAVEKIRSGAETSAVWITERGTSFGHDDLVVDFRNFDLLAPLGCPIVFDASHSAKYAKHIETLSKSALAAGAHKLFLEVHDRPEQALSDGTTSYPLSELPGFIGRLIKK
jgi:2-dehydro-3-deoxyphosphooctonate aldolase (KDO 8-P synthase)